ncbi:3-deoxy-7-phosphoheptulonate synthase [Nocardiopsis kunsanensis]|uniref:3-deoxy-7-phosphoheptulonate synthase n=1 Tax=Nocardiopsis kunsanensis TaxID=141693 RepID=UPI0018767D3D|nr:3-deoxy-7-phosphoheptulonate synthase [Nocardiopsis kunsanensis]
MKITHPESLTPAASQQPDWAEDPELAVTRRRLAARPPLTRIQDIDRLRTLLGRVAEGKDRVIVAGDCAEDPGECAPGDVDEKDALVRALAGVMERTTGRDVVRAGRIGGQFAKPRSSSTERVGGVELPAYRGHMVNSPEPVHALRLPDPAHMLSCYASAEKVIAHLWGEQRQDTHRTGGPLWTSHEALLLDYEIPMIRTSDDRREFLSSTHWPWIGDRTRAPEGNHTTVLARIANPVACKVGPSCTVPELLEVCRRLDPGREPGRLTLVARMGAGRAPAHLAGLVRAVRNAGHPVIWLSDPMHGNTTRTSDGLKTRYMESVLQEVREFQELVDAEGGVPGGLHLETTPENVTECVTAPSQAHRAGDRYTSLCDPRLNPAQAIAVASAWYR